MADNRSYIYLHARTKPTYPLYPAWVDKQALRDQVPNDRNGGVRLCPLFDPNAIAAAIDGLPDTLAADDSTWTMVYDFDGKPAWLFP